MRLDRVLLGCCLLSLRCVSAAFCADIYVPSDHVTIQAAIDAASNGDHIWVAQGTYGENLDFAGKAITITGYVHPLFGRKTILSPTAAGPCVTFQSGEGSNSVLEKMRLTNGVSGHGGGVLCRNNSSPTIRNCGIYRNSASAGGGGVGAEAGSSPNLLDNDITDNDTSNGFGGGVWYEGAAAPTISGNNISNNTAKLNGGGLDLTCSGTAVIKDNTLEGNTAGMHGGGMAVWNGSPTLTSNVIRNNTAASGSGAVRLTNCTTFVLTGNTITGNTTPGAVGGVNVDHTAGSITGNAIANNQAGGTGGGLSCGYAPATLEIVNNLICGNTSGTGVGGLYVDQSAATVRNNTISGNGGPSVGNVRFYRSTSTLTNCLITFATSGGGLTMDAMYSVVTQSYCDVFGNVGGDYPGLGTTVPTGTNGNISSDPRYANPAAGDFHLRSCNGRWNPASSSWIYDNTTSPGIDAGDPASDFAAEAAPNGALVNLGAYGNTPEASRSTWLFTHRPAYEGTNVPRVQPLFMRFRKQVVQGSVETRLKVTPDGGDPVSGTFLWTQPFLQVEWWPQASLTAATRYTVQLSQGVRGRDGTLTNWTEQWAFTTGNQPGIKAHGPLGDSVSPAATIRLTFDTTMHRVSCQNNFRISPEVAGTFTWLGNQLTFTPGSPLDPGTTYTVKMLRKARSSTGVELGWPYSWSFTTAAAGSAPLAIRAAAAPTPSGAQVAIHLSTAADVQTTVLNLAGRAVATLPEQSCGAGTTTLLWNGRAAQGTLVPGGTYLLRVTARAANGAQASALASCRLRR